MLVVKNCSQEAPVTVAALGVPYHGQGRKRNTLVPMAKPCLVTTSNEVLNEVYLQNFLHRCVVIREMNLMMLINL